MATGIIRFKTNSRGVINLLKDPALQADLGRRGRNIENALPTANGEEWETKQFLGFDRAQVIVKTSNQAARESAAERNSLLNGLNAGR